MKTVGESRINATVLEALCQIFSNFGARAQARGKLRKRMRADRKVNKNGVCAEVGKKKICGDDAGAETSFFQRTGNKGM